MSRGLLIFIVAMAGAFASAKSVALSVLYPTPTETLQTERQLSAIGIISTVVGTGIGGYTGDGGLAIAAEVQSPLGIDFDALGNLFFSDFGNSVVRRVLKSTGIISTVVGTGAFDYTGDGGIATSAALGFPAGIALDSSGNMYIADSAYDVIRMVLQSTGIISTVAGSGGYGYTGDGGLATAATLSGPAGIALDSSGNLYIAETDNRVIRKVLISTGIISTVAGTGIAGYTGDGGLATSATFWYPRDLVFDASGNMYISDSGNDVIRKVLLSTGIVSTVAGSGGYGYTGDGGLATSATFRFPNNIAIDSYGNLYIADQGNNVVRKVLTSTGIISTVAGTGGYGYTGDGGPATLAELNAPSGIALDATGDIYVTSNECFQNIRSFTPVASRAIPLGAFSSANVAGPPSPV